LELARQDEVTAAVTAIAKARARARASIEQTKGMLMLIYGMDEASAFELLKWRSRVAELRRPTAI
jgi:AmiR/NasT family two-component response regulator